uniref:Saposin B-type domain-containing protein n=1 Tax=Caenorhabditis japonica TaxID=281687 RepID=A0A8R1E4B9_CAEJA
MLIELSALVLFIGVYGNIWLAISRFRAAPIAELMPIRRANSYFQRLIATKLPLSTANSHISATLVPLQEVKPNYKVTKYTYTRDNDTDVMDQELPDVQVIPLDFLCEFCQVVIIKLKERQASEPDFEQKIRSECLNSSADNSSSLCDVISRVNLDRLRNDDPKSICDSQNMCTGAQEPPQQKTGPPATSPKVAEDVKPSENDAQIVDHLTVDEKEVNATLNVDDVSPY